MLKYTLPLLAFGALLTGCPGDSGKCDTADTAGCDTGAPADDSGGEGGGDPSFSVSWTTAGANFAVTNGDGSYTLGIAETNGSSDPWTGEDCLNGYNASGTLFLYCHPLSSTGGSFTSIYADVVAGSRTLSSLDENTETLFDDSFEEGLTYGVWSDTSGDCWTWGADTSYYTGEGCTAI